MLGIYDINLSSELSYKQRLDIYKNCGFEEIAIYLDQEYQRKGENYIDIIAYARKIGLEINQVHIDWQIANEICNEDSDRYFEYITAKLKEANTFKIKYIIAHASKSDNPPILSNTQLAKFKSMMQNLKGLDTTLCIENVRRNENLDKILELNLDNVKVCFDLGHAHAYGNEKEIFKKYKNKIRCSHLHNNYGSDTHELLDNGEIDYKYFVKELVKMSNVSNCLECFPPMHSNLNKTEFENFIKHCYHTATQIN